MAGQRTLPGLGLSAFWTVGSNNWEQQHDPDTRKISVLCQCSVLSRVTNLPGSPSNGDIYIIPVGQTDENKIAARDNGEWVLYTPIEGWLAFVKDQDLFYYYTGSAWALWEGGSGDDDVVELTIVNKTDNHTLELSDAGCYLRMNAAGAKAFTVPPNASVAFPTGTVMQLRQVGAGQVTITAGVGVTINTPETLKCRKQGSTVSIVKVGTNEWDITGDLELA